jgi:chromosome segregation ATPase
MGLLDEELTALKDEQKKKQKAITAAATAMQEAQAKLNQMNADSKSTAARIAQLQKSAQDLLSNQDEIGKLGKAAKEEADAATTFCDDLEKALKKELTEEQRKGYAQAMKGVDSAIAEKEKQLKTLQQQTADASEAHAEARKTLSDAEADYKTALARITAIPRDIESARKRVAALRVAAKSAKEAGRLKEAYCSLLDMREALVEVDGLIDPKTAKQLTDALGGRWDKLEEAKQEVAKAVAALEDARGELSPVEKDLHDKRQQRDADIKAL